MAAPRHSGIGQDLPCLSCAYNLRGLEISGRCPECGLAINATLKGRSLFEVDPRWLRSTLRGLSLLAAFHDLLMLNLLVAAFVPILQIGVIAVFTLLFLGLLLASRPLPLTSLSPVNLRRMITLACSISAVCVGWIDLLIGHKTFFSASYAAPLPSWLWIIVPLCLFLTWSHIIHLRSTIWIQHRGRPARGLHLIQWWLSGCALVLLVCLEFRADVPATLLFLLLLIALSVAAFTVQRMAPMLRADMQTHARRAGLSRLPK